MARSSSVSWSSRRNGSSHANASLDGWLPPGFVMTAPFTLQPPGWIITLPRCVRDPRGQACAPAGAWPKPSATAAATGRAGQSEQAAAVRHLALGADQNDLAVGIGEAEGEHLRHELADLARGEVHHGGNLAADQRSRVIVFRDLRRAFLLADLGAEVDPEPDGRLAGAIGRLGGDDRADADVHLEEVVEGDARRRSGFVHRPLVLSPLSIGVRRDRARPAGPAGPAPCYGSPASELWPGGGGGGVGRPRNTERRKAGPSAARRCTTDVTCSTLRMALSPRRSRRSSA